MPNGKGTAVTEMSTRHLTSYPRAASIILASLTLILTGCAQNRTWDPVTGLAGPAVKSTARGMANNSARQTHPGKITILYWDKYADFENAAVTALVNRYNQSQTNVFVEYEGHHTEQNIDSAQSGWGPTPDIIGCSSASLASQEMKDVPANLSALFFHSGFDDHYFLPAAYNSCIVDGHILAIPVTLTTPAMYYNLNILKEVGWDTNKLPQTFEDLDHLNDLCKQANASGIQRLGFMPEEPGWWNWSWPYYFGGSLFDEKNETWDFAKPENEAAFTYTSHFAKEFDTSTYEQFRFSFGPFNSPNNAFFTGKLACVMQGPWFSHFIGVYAPSLQYGVAPIPHPLARPDLAGRGVYEADVVMVSKDSQHVAEAMDFIKYMDDPANNDSLCQGMSRISPLLKESDDFDKHHPNPFISVFRKSVEGKTFMYPNLIKGEEAAKAFASKFDEMQLSQISVHEALQELQQKLASSEAQSQTDLQNKIQSESTSN